MKKFLLPVILLLVVCCFSACSSTQTEEEPYNRNKKVAYENKLRKANFVPFMYENKFYAYYALAKRVEGPTKKGVYTMRFINGPKEGETIHTQDVILKTYGTNGYDLKKGMVVLVNHWDPKNHDENARTDMWRKAVVYSLRDLDKNKVIVEFPHDRNDFVATKEVYDLSNIRIITKPEVKDIRIFLD